MSTEDIIDRLYDRFNARDIDSVLALLDSNVEWENGMHGGFVRGHEALRQYWTTQWKSIDPLVRPITSERNRDTCTVRVHQIVRALDGTIMSDTTVIHAFRFAAGKVVRFDIVREK